MIKYLGIFILLFSFFSCKEESKRTAVVDADTLLENTINAHGGNLYKNSIISFKFKSFNYTLKRDDNDYEYQMIREEKDVLKEAKTFNGGFEYFEDGEQKELSARLSSMFTNRINSMAYWIYIPYEFSTNDAIKEYIGKDVLRGNEYHKLKITYRQFEGLPEDDRIYILWIDTKKFEIDFVAVGNLNDTNGKKFYAAGNKRKIKGMLFSDYEMYNTKTKSKEINFEDLGTSYNIGAMLRDNIVTYENISVERVN